MLRLNFKSLEKGLNLPLYHLTEEKSREKSTFVDSNRIDTVKIRPGELPTEAFIKSSYFNKIILVDCYEAIKSNNRVVSLSDVFRNNIISYLENFFVDNKLGVIISKSDDYYSYRKINIKIQLNENATFEDIGNTYISELKRINLSEEDISAKQLKLTKKINNEGK